MNFFGNKQMGMKRNPLSVLMQPNLKEMLMTPPDGDEIPVKNGTPSPEPLPNVGGKPVFIPGPKTDVSPAIAEQLYKQFQQEQSVAPPQKQGTLKEFMTTPIIGGDKSMLMTKPEQEKLYDWLNKPQWFLPPKTGYVPGTGEVPTKLPASMVPEQPMYYPDGSNPQQPQQGQQPQAESGLDAILTSDEKEKNGDLAFGGGMVKSAMGATTELLQKYGQMAQSLEGAKAALHKEFQDTPELDQIIAETQKELANTRSNRKQPGIGEFLTMALMNLSGMNPRQSADLVLGLGNQKGDEMRLEDRLAQLEGSRAGAKMHGRQALRGMQQQEKYQALQNMMRQQESGRKQRNEDRDFGFKSQKLGYDKLMQELGQVRQQMQFETDPNKRKALQQLIDRLDPYGQQQQQRPKPQDERQSRMFGDMLGGGGYA